MITITYKGKTYKPTPTFNDFISKIVCGSITEGGLEEVKENKETLGELCNLDTKPSDFSDYAHSKDTSILEKLRAEITERRDQANKDSNEGNETNRRYFEGKDVAYTACLVWIDDLLTSLEQSQTKEEPQPQEEIELPGVPYYCSRGNKFPIQKELQEINSQMEALTKFCKAIAPIVNQLITNKKLGK